MLHPPKHIDNQSGAITIMAGLLILVILSLIAISGTNTTIIETTVASYDQSYKIAFYNADSGIFGTPKLISQAINTSGAVPVGAGTIAEGIDYVPTIPPSADPADDFYRQLLGFDAYDGGLMDITFEPTNIPTQTDVRRDRQENLIGGSTEFGSGAEGIGTGTTGGVAIFYALRSDGQGPASSGDTSVAELGAEYRKVVALAGGL